MTSTPANISAPRRLFRRPAPRSARRRRGVSVLWAVPGLALGFAVHLVAVGAGGWYAFTDWNGISAGANWVGLDNFREIFQDTTARHALVQTIELAAAYVVAVNVIGLVLALATNRTVKSRHLLRVLIFAPFVLSQLATAYIWRFIFDFNGPVNALLGSLGLGSWKRTWLGDPKWALWSVLAVMVWQGAGLAMSFYLAGLASVPEELDEAAAVDGASMWLRLRSVTLPLLAPAMTVSITLATIQGLRVFDVVMALTNGGPGDATETLTTQLYKQGFAENRYGYGAAFALLLTVLIAAISLIQIVVLRRREAKI